MKKSIRKLFVIFIFLLSFIMAMLYLFTIRSGKAVIPLQENDISCSINFTEKFGEFEVSITNAKGKKLKFLKPRVITKYDMENTKNLTANSIKVQLEWDHEGFAELQYLSYNGTEIRDEIITLAPGETKKIIYNMEDSIFQRRCNMIPFNEGFTKGETEISATLTIFSIINDKDVVIAKSKRNTFKAKYIGP